MLQVFPNHIEKILKTKQVYYDQLHLVDEGRGVTSFCERFKEYYQLAKTPRDKLDALVCLICSASSAIEKGARIVSLATEMIFQGDFREQSQPDAHRRLQELLEMLKIPITAEEILSQIPKEESPARVALKAFEKLFCAWQSLLERVKDDKEAFDKQIPFPTILIDRNPYIPSSISLIETLTDFYDQIGSLAQLTALHCAYATSTSLEEFQASGPFSDQNRFKPFPEWQYEFCLTGKFPPKIDQFLLRISFWAKEKWRDNSIENAAEAIFKKMPQFYDEPQSDEEKFRIIKKISRWIGNHIHFYMDSGLKHAISSMMKPSLSPFQKIAYLSENPPAYLRITTFHKNMQERFLKYVSDISPKALPQTEAEAKLLGKKHWKNLQNLVSELLPVLPRERPWIQRLMQDAQKLSECIGSDIKTVRQAYKRIFRRFSHFQKKKEIWSENLMALTRLWMQSLEQKKETYWSRFCERISMMRRCIEDEKWIGPRASQLNLYKTYLKLKKLESSIGPREAVKWKETVLHLRWNFFTDYIDEQHVLEAFYYRYKAKHWAPIMERFHSKGVNYVQTLLMNYELLIFIFQKEWLELAALDEKDPDTEFQTAVLRHDLESPKQINPEQLELALKITNSRNPTILLKFLRQLPQHHPNISFNSAFIPQMSQDLDLLAKEIARVATMPRKLSILDFISELFKALPEVVKREEKILEIFMGAFLPMLLEELPSTFFSKMPLEVTTAWINCFKKNRFREGLSVVDSLTLMPLEVATAWINCFKKNRFREGLSVVDSLPLNWKDHHPVLMRAIARYYSELKIARPKKVLTALLEWTKQTPGFSNQMEGAVAYLRCGGDKENLQELIPTLFEEWPKDIHKKKRLLLLSALPKPILNTDDVFSIPYLMKNLSKENLEKARELVLTADWDPKSSTLHNGRKPIKCEYDYFRDNPLPFMAGPRIIMERIINGWVALLWDELKPTIEEKITLFLECKSQFPKLENFQKQLSIMTNTRWITQQLMLPQGASVLRILTDRQGHDLFEESVLSLLTTGCQKPDFTRIGKQDGASWAKTGSIFATSNPEYAKSWFHDGASAMIVIKGSFHNQQQIEGEVRHEYEGSFNHIYMNGVPRDVIPLIVLPVSWQQDLQALFDKRKEYDFTVASIKELSEKSRNELGRSLREKIDGSSFFERIQFYPPQSDWLGLIAKHQLQTTTKEQLLTENVRWEIGRNLVEEMMPPGYFMLPDRALAEASDSLFAELLPRTMYLMPKSLKKALSGPNNHGRTSSGRRHTIEEHTMEVISGNELAFGLYTDVVVKDWTPEEVRRVLRLAALLHDSGKKEGCDEKHILRSSERAERLLKKCKHYFGVRKREIPVIRALIEVNDRFGLYLQGKITKAEIINCEIPHFTRNEWGRLLFTLFMADASTLKVVSSKREKYMQLREQLNTLDFESMDWLDSLI